MKKSTEHKLREYQIIKRDFFEQECKPKHFSGHEEDFNVMEFIGIVSTVAAGLIFAAVLIIQILKFYR